ncbi:hypothetical protein ATZ36_16050 [Candidatus Endomicrobiellum trichonymphae]|uniref:Uncharacterized protein n=1 Tax=Endomicrobium trichonymphae TaxID=1408204 RepID=A0A1E5IL05_ENDTX|nr:hypothetical protein ATZ36_16050 [Candidatus Endomicrobium trichonymphae]
MPSASNTNNIAAIKPNKIFVFFGFTSLYIKNNFLPIDVFMIRINKIIPYCAFVMIKIAVPGHHLINISINL